MKKIYKRVAWLLDDGVLLKGYTSKRKFVSDNKGCGFSYQIIRKKDIGKILFYNNEDALKIQYRIKLRESIQKVSKIASEWWADKVAKPKFDNGDDSSTGGFAICLALMNTKSVNNESRGEFIEFLSKSIEKNLIQEHKNWTPEIILDVDYEPCRELSEAGEYAGIPHSNFPWKTTMWIDKNHVSVRYGYGANEEYLYVNKTYWQTNINSLRDSIEEYQNGNAFSWIENKEERNARVKERVADMEKRIKEYQNNLAKAED